MMLPIKKEASKLQIFLNTYQVLRSNIEFYKRQQWQISYYGIAVNAALSFLYLDKSACYPGLKSPIMALGILASIICTIIISLLEHSIISEVKSIRRIYNTMPLLDSIIDCKSYTTSNCKKNVEIDLSIFCTNEHRNEDNKDEHGIWVFILSVIAVLISLGFLFCVSKLQNITGCSH